MKAPFITTFMLCQALAQASPRTSSDYCIPAETVDRAGQLYANEATVQLAQTLNSPDAVAKDPKHYLADLPDELQRVLKAQLNRPGDVSAVIETPNGFLVFRCLARDAATLKASSLTIRKCGYDEWLSRQSKSSP